MNPAPRASKIPKLTHALSLPPQARRCENGLTTLPPQSVAHHPPSDAAPELSIVVPALNEEDNVAPLVAEVEKTVRGVGVDAELIVVDDGSTDQTLPRLREMARSRPWLRVLHRDQPRGQSSAMFAGIQAARGRWIATLDADLQNDPAELPKMLEICRKGDADMVQGDRSHARKDNIVRRCGSVVGRKARGLILNDPIRDTGCSARVVRADIAKQFPLMFKGMHRFMPVYARMLGARIVEFPVCHRPRNAGTTKYGLGVLNRGISGFFDALAVRWMLKRYRDTAAELQKVQEL